MYPKPHAPQLPDLSRRRTWRYYLAAGLIMVLGLLIGVHALWDKHATAQAQATMAQQLHAAALVHQADDAFSANYAAIVKQYPATKVSVTVATDRSGLRTQGTHDAFDAASTAKVITAAAYLHQVDQGIASLQLQIAGQSAIYWLRAMIIDSDDEAWAVLNSYLTHDTLAAYAQSNGLSKYDPDTNQATSQDMAILLQKLAKGELLNARRATLLEALMTKANFRDYIVAAAPGGVAVAHKVGFTDGNVHDVAVLSRSGHWLVLSVFTNGDASNGLNDRSTLLQALTKAALKAYLP